MIEVVVTGMGVTTPLGNTPDTLFANLLAGKSGVRKIQRFSTDKFKVQFAGEVQEFDPSPYFEPKEVARTSRYIQYVMHCGIEAVKQAGLYESKDLDKHRAGIIVGSGMGGIDVFTENSQALEKRGPNRVSPFFIPEAISNMGCGMLGIALKWMGPNWSCTSACATGNHSIMVAADQIRLGRADVMLAGGSEEAVCEISLAGFANMKALSRNNENPEKASRPFDVGRDGFVMGEGGGVIVLESREHAEARGAKILARITGYGASCDGYHMSAPLESGDGVALAIDSALKDGKLSPKDIGLINCHATSTPLGDVAEVKAIRKIFGKEIDNTKLQGTKSMLGHPLGAASAIEAVVAIQSLLQGKAHPTINVDEQDPNCDVDCIANTAIALDTEYIMSNSFGFGGHNSSVIFGKV